MGIRRESDELVDMEATVADVLGDGDHVWVVLEGVHSFSSCLLLCFFLPVRLCAISPSALPFFVWCVFHVCLLCSSFLWGCVVCVCCLLLSLCVWNCAWFPLCVLCSYFLVSFVVLFFVPCFVCVCRALSLVSSLPAF